MVVNINHKKDPWDARVLFQDLPLRRGPPDEYINSDWVECEVPKKLLCGYEQATTGGLYPDRRVARSVEPSSKVTKWLNKNCTGEWRWFYRVLGGYDRVTFLSFEKAQDLFYFRLRF